MFPQSVACPAKVNWTLQVGPRMESGFHQLETHLLALALHDILRLELDPNVPKGHFALEIEGPAFSSDIPIDGRNLILRAAQRVAQWQRQAWENLPCGLRFRLQKNIPSQAGLGGGSSNAAAAALALLRGLEVDWEEAALLALLAELGSDCPFFGYALGASERAAEPRNQALGHGRGEKILPIPGRAPDMQICVITPDVACPTAGIYGALEHPRKERSNGPSVRSWAQLREDRCNDLEEAALAATPDLRAWRQVLTDSAGDAFQLSGSGASFYGVVPGDRNSATWCADLLAELARSHLKPRFHWTGPLWSGTVLGSGPS